MKAQELMYGNYLLKNTEIVTVLNIFGASGLVQFKEEPFQRIPLGVADVKGIPLTEEWLKRMGFDNTIDDELPPDADFLVYFLPISSYSVEVIPDNIGLKNKYVFCIYEDVIDKDGELASQGVYEQQIECVHEVQNLYYSLTKTQLI